MEINNLPSSASEAIKSASKYYFTGKSCPKGHFSKRFTLNSSCYQCYLENKSKKRQRIKEVLNNSKLGKNTGEVNG